MSGSPPTYILPGRHQPPHFDHLQLIEAALQRIPAELYLGLVTSSSSRGGPDTDFERCAREHHSPERAPFSFDQRRRMVEAALLGHFSSAERSRVLIIPLPRPELDFGLIEGIFPGPRVWIVPKVGEAFDELKVEFFKGKGERVLRVHGRGRISGRVVRDLVQAEAWRQLEDYMPKGVIQILRQERMRKQAT